MVIDWSFENSLAVWLVLVRLDGFEGAETSILYGPLCWAAEQVPALSQALRWNQ
jgi:hypothetical protein